MKTPRLTETGTKYFISETLKQCNRMKYYYYNNLFNICLFCVFFLILALVIYFSYKNKKNPVDKEEENIKAQQYILNMAKQLNNKRLKENGTKITDLPEFESEFEITMKKFI